MDYRFDHPHLAVNMPHQSVELSPRTCRGRERLPLHLQVERQSLLPGRRELRALVPAAALHIHDRLREFLLHRLHQRPRPHIRHPDTPRRRRQRSRRGNPGEDIRLARPEDKFPIDHDAVPQAAFLRRSAGAFRGGSVCRHEDVITDCVRFCQAVGIWRFRPWHAIADGMQPIRSLEQSRECIAAAIQPLAPIRSPLAHVRGAVLREEARAREDMPAFDRSAMDGYAVAEGEGKFRIVGEVRPGSPPQFVLAPGECARIFTGAQIPQGATRVMMQEDVTVEAGSMTPGPDAAGNFIRRKGEDARTGDILLRSGVRLGAAEIGLLASIGLVEPLVSPRCKVAHFATGDELVDPSQTPGPSGLRDSNSALVRAFVESHGGEMVLQERIGDDAALLTRKLEADCDLLLISGGASVGAYDFGKTALERAGFELQFPRINLRPGKPLVFAMRGQQAAFVLPGNPLSHLTVLHCVVSVAFDRLAGAAPAWSVLHARLRAGIHIGGDGRDTLWPAHVEMVDGEPVVDALRWQSSGDITGMAGLNAFIRCAVPVLDTGARVPCILVHG